MRFVAALRSGPNLTNVRTEALVEGLKAHGHDVELIGREEIVKGADLLIQTGFAASNALRSQIDQQKPYLIMEAPFWRSFYPVQKCSSWNYNGLAGGAFAPETPSEPRNKPNLHEPRVGLGGTLIIGQKPTDHSLRGSDHVSWIIRCRNQIPEADFRPHPLMVPAGTLGPIEDDFEKYGTFVTYTSTVGVEALVAGCKVRADHRGSLAYEVTDREQWHHDLSYRQAPNSEFGVLVPHILSGYDEARERARCGDVEHPREKVRSEAIQKAYYALLGKG
jgi:hypothetical protein